MSKFRVGETVWTKSTEEIKATVGTYIPPVIAYFCNYQYIVNSIDECGRYILKEDERVVCFEFAEEWLESEEEHEARTRKEEKVMKFKDLKVGTLFRCNTSTMFVKTKFCIMTDDGRLQYISPIIGPDARVTNYVTFIDEDEVTPINIDEPKHDGLWVIAQDALEHFGATTQICQTMEECAELIQALNKSLRHQSDPEKVRHNILEELADVTIMVEQMKLHFDEEEEFDEILEAKKDKLRSYLSEQEAD